MIVFVIIALVFLVFMMIFFINYNQHTENVPHKYISFSEFKKEFYEKEWQRDINFKLSYFNFNNDNFINTNDVLIDNKIHMFNMFSYLRFLIFLFKNRTTKKNENVKVNGIIDIRKRKLQKLKI